MALSRNEQQANPADLAALPLDRLRSIGTTIQTGNSDWRQYWNEDSHGRPHRPKHEDSCWDALLSQLRARLPDGVHADSEGQYAGDRRSDIRVSCGSFNVPVEIKKDAHRDVWSAIRDQLIKHYTRDAETGTVGSIWCSGSAGVTCRHPHTGPSHDARRAGAAP